MRLEDRLGRRVKLRDLNVLMAVVEAGTMARAAERLAVSQPVVSKTIAHLERVFGVVLLDRSHRGIEPTAYGRALVARGAAVFDELRQATRDIEHLADPSTGEIRLSASEAMVAGILTHAIDHVRQSHPRLSVHVRSVVAGPWLYDDLRAREVDFAVGHLATSPADSDLAAEVILRERILVVTGRDTPLPAERPLRLEHLLDRDWILPRPDSQGGILLRQAFQALGLDLPPPAVTCNSIMMIAALLATGRYFAFLSASIIQAGEFRQWIRVVLTLSDVPPGLVGIVTLAGRTLTPAAELFIRHLRLLARDLDEAPLEVEDGPVLKVRSGFLRSTS